MNTVIQGTTVLDVLRGIARNPRRPHMSITSVCDSVDDGYVTVHGADVEIANAHTTTVLEPRATMRDACLYLYTFVETGAAARGVRYVIACENGIRIEMCFHPTDHNNHMDIEPEP